MSKPVEEQKTKRARQTAGSGHSERSRGIYLRTRGALCPQADVSTSRCFARHDRREALAFTLIELLVVIAVIALLMAILLPVLGRVRQQGRATVCQSNLRQWGATLTLYTQDSEGRLPSWQAPALLLLRGPFGSDDNRGVSSSAQVRTQGIACCPTAVGVRADEDVEFIVTSDAVGSSMRVEGRYGSTFEAWEITGLGPPFRCSYGFNGWLFDRHFDASAPVRRGKLGLDIFSVRGRANTPVFLDAAKLDGTPHNRSRPPWRELHGPDVGMQTFCVNRHIGHINGLFMDWSVRKVGLKELWTLKWYSEFDTRGRWTKAGGVQPEDWPEWMRRFKDY